jgi:hypothetical protein
MPYSGTKGVHRVAVARLDRERSNREAKKNAKKAKVESLRALRCFAVKLEITVFAKALFRQAKGLAPSPVLC